MGILVTVNFDLKNTQSRLSVLVVCSCVLNLDSIDRYKGRMILVRRILKSLKRPLHSPDPYVRPQQQTSPLLSLPYEIKALIYEYLLGEFVYVYDIILREWRHPPDMISLLSVCKDLSVDVKPILLAQRERTAMTNFHVATRERDIANIQVADKSSIRHIHLRGNGIIPRTETALSLFPNLESARWEIGCSSGPYESIEQGVAALWRRIDVGNFKPSIKGIRIEIGAHFAVDNNDGVCTQNVVVDVHERVVLEYIGHKQPKVSLRPAFL